MGKHSGKKIFKRVFENLGLVSTPLKSFLKDFWDKWKMGYEEKEVGGFSKEKTLVIMYSPGAI
jgi:hypothetical protein